jgi:adenosylmethionine-8-amino-7-oxononanoate aminotransferase
LSGNYIKRFSATENQPIFETAQGPFVNGIFDSTLGGGCNILGYNTDVFDVIKKQDYFMFSTSKFDHPVYHELADALSFRSLTDVYYSGNTGSDAIECALKAAYDINGKSRYIARQYAFHGATHTANSLGINGSFKQYESMFKTDIIRIPTPHLKTWTKTISEKAREELEFIKTQDGIGAIIIEPFPGPSTQMRYQFDTAHAYDDLREYCDRHEICIIFDEIYSGFKTGGRYFTEKLAIDPDFLCLSKGLTAGVIPFNAILAQRGHFDKMQHGHTWSGFYLGAIAALETVRRVIDLKDHVAYMNERYHKYFDNGVGMYWAFDTSRLKKTDRVFTRTVWNDTTLFTPPINTIPEEMNFAIKEMFGEL